MHKYVGRTVDIIYIDRTGKFSQRRIRIHAVRGEFVRAFCHAKRVFRIFRLENILAVQLVSGRAQ